MSSPEITLPLTDRISQSSTKTKQFNIIESRFGDGYSERAPNGINNVRDRWTLMFENLTSTERNTVWDFVESVGRHEWFTWTAHGDTAEKRWVIADNPREQVSSGNTYSVTIVIEQVFDLG